MFVDNAVGGVGQVLNGPIDGLSTLGDRLSYDPGLRRPYFDERGRPCVTMNTGKWTWDEKQRRHLPVQRKELIANLQARGINSPVLNATALRKEEWLELDRVVLRAARYRLRAWADLAAANSFGGFNAMGKLILEHETMSDPGEAIVDMDALTPGRGDAPLFQLQGLPLPITHCDFWFSARTLAVSRNTGTPLDTTMGEAAGRRIAETIEKTLIGNVTGVTYGGNSTMVGGYGRTSQVFGYINFPNRLVNTKFYKPTGLGRSGTAWIAQDTVRDVLAALDQLRLNKFYGPFMAYHSNDWDQYLDSDYFTTTGAGGISGVSTATLRNRLRMIEGIQDVRRLDFLFATIPQTNPAFVNVANPFTGPGGEGVVSGNPFTMIIVQMTPDVCRAVNGMDITTVQWESVGGMRLNFKCFAIQVPQLRADYYGNCGILHAVATN
jgi:hypothetical protein